MSDRESHFSLTGEQEGEQELNLRIETKFVDVTSHFPQPLKSWRYTDAAGHEHCYVEGKDHYPTLRWVVDRRYWCESCREDHDEGHSECIVCGEHIEPGTFVDYTRQSRPGMRSYFINDEPVYEEEFKRVVENRGMGLDLPEGER